MLLTRPWSCLCLSVNRLAYSVRLICVSAAGHLSLGLNEKGARYKELAGKSAQAAVGEAQSCPSCVCWWTYSLNCRCQGLQEWLGG